MFLWTIYVLSFIGTYSLCKKFRDEVDANNWIDVFISIAISLIGPIALIIQAYNYLLNRRNRKTFLKKPPEWL